jgi:hypothetical protein
MILILSAIEAYTTTITEIPELQPVDSTTMKTIKIGRLRTLWLYM